MRILLSFSVLATAGVVSAQCKITGTPDGAKTAYVHQPVNDSGHMVFTISHGPAGWSVAPSVEYDSVVYHLRNAQVVQRWSEMRPHHIDDADREVLAGANLDSLTIHKKRRLQRLSTLREPGALREALLCVAEYRGPVITPEQPEITEVTDSPGELIARGARERTAGLIVQALAVGAALAVAGTDQRSDLPLAIGAVGGVIGFVLEIGGNSKQARGGDLLKARGY